MEASPLYTARELLNSRYKNALGLFIGGSVVRGEASDYSDLDVIVILPKITSPFRESFFFKEWTVEAYAFDLEHLEEYFQKTAPVLGVAEIHQMVLEGIAMGQPDVLELVKSKAQFYYEQGPQPLDGAELTFKRYQLRAFADDLRDPRDRTEILSSGSLLYQGWADYHLRAQRNWSAHGKTLQKLLKKADLEFYNLYQSAFDELFSHSKPESLVALLDLSLKVVPNDELNDYRIETESNWPERLVDSAKTMAETGRFFS